MSSDIDHARPTAPAQPDAPMTAREERSERTAELFARRETAPPSGRAAVEEEIVTVNMPMARSAVRRFRGRGIADEDIEQVAYLGLVKAVQGYQLDRGHDFLSYAVPTIRGEVRRYFRDRGWMVRPTRSIQETQGKILGCETELYQQLGRAPRPSEIAEHLGLEVEAVIEALGANGCFAPDSLDVPVRAGDVMTVGETLSFVDGQFDDAEVRAMLAPLLARLSARERLIVELRFVRGYTQAEIGSEIGVSQMQVSRLLSRLLLRLRKQLQNDVVAA